MRIRQRTEAAGAAVGPDIHTAARPGGNAMRQGHGFGRSYQACGCPVVVRCNKAGAQRA
jgi:hypothetical protein